MLRNILLSLAVTAEAYIVGTPMRAPLRAATPKMMVPSAALETVTPIAAVTTTIADDGIDALFLASSTGALLFVALIVGAIVVNFGIMKK